MHLEVDAFWSERNGALFETELCNFDRLSVSATSLTLSGSELTMPDCCETYPERSSSDFIPCLAPTQTHSNAFDNALEEFENLPYALDASSASMMHLFGQSVSQASVETSLTDKRRFSAPLRENCLTKMEESTDASKSIFNAGLQSCPQFSWLDESGPVCSRSEEKPVEAVEQSLPIEKLHYLKDNRFSSTGSRLSWYWGSSESDTSVIIPGTDVDTIEDSQDESTRSSVELCAAFEDEESRANNVELHQERLSPEYKLHNARGESLKDPFDINDILTDVSMPQTNEVVLEVHKESKRRKRLSLRGILRFITCSKTLKRMDG